jgi:DNA-binding NtrC family response regulator
MNIELSHLSAPATRVFVMSADPQLGSVLNVLLQDRGFHTTGCTSARQGMDTVDQGKADIVILDECLPDMLGTDLLQQFIIQYPEVPVVFLTKDPRSNAAIEAILLGTFAVIAKPVQVNQLALILVGARARKQQQQPFAVTDQAPPMSAAMHCQAITA